MGEETSSGSLFDRRLEGRVDRLTLRVLKDGQHVRHDTRITFTSPGPFKSVRVGGKLPSVGWEKRLLAALESRYKIHGGLPIPKWHGGVQP